jgi:putative hydrolase of the HAD superfamily
MKTIFFDIDGTLYDEKAAKVKAEIEVSRLISRKSGRDFREIHGAFLNYKEQVAASMPTDPGRNNRALWYEVMLDRLELKGFNPEKLCEEYWAVVLNEIEPYADLMAILPEIYKKYDLWIVTDELRRIQERKMIRLGLTRFFSGIFSSEDMGYVKPDPRLFEYALKEAKASKEETVMIGDNPRRDIKGANLAGITSIFFRRGEYYYYPLAGDEKPKHIFSDYTKLPALLSSIDRVDKLVGILR